MKAIHLTGFGRDNLSVVDVPDPGNPSAGQVLVKFNAASVNPRDSQIIDGHFTPNVDFPLVPLSDGAGEVVAVGEGVSTLAAGDRVTPLFFPNWMSGEALGDERKISSGLETPGVMRELGLYPESALVRYAKHLSPEEAACLPCAALTAWTSLVDKSGIGPGDTVLIQGTGGVAVAALQISKALGAQAIVISSSEAKLERAKELGADHLINYTATEDWGDEAYEIAGSGVDAVIEIGGSGTLENSLAAIRHGGHVNIIGYMAGVEMGITVFPLIIKNANLHGIGTGHRQSYEAMMKLIESQAIRPVIEREHGFDELPLALDHLEGGAHFGKLVVRIP